MKRFGRLILGLIAAAVGVLLPPAPRTPEIVQFKEHPFVKRLYVKTIAGGCTVARLVRGMVRTAVGLINAPLVRSGFALQAGDFAPGGGLELIQPGQDPTGPVGTAVANAGDVRYMRPVLAENQHQLDPAVNATLRHEEWETVDAMVNGVFRERLTVAEDLRSRGLVQPVSVGTIIRRTERLKDGTAADIHYDGDADSQSDRAIFEAQTVPVPIISKGFEIGFRQLDASRNRGEPLDLTNAAQAARKVRDRLQDLITNGIASGGPAGGGIPGLITAGNSRLTVGLGYNWDDPNGDPIGDTKRMLAEAYANSLFGNFVIYVSKNYWAHIQGDYSAAKGDRTFLERMLAFDGVEAVRPNDALPDDNVVMVQMTRDVIDLSEAQRVTTVQWQKNPFVTMFRVLMIGGPHLKLAHTDQGTSAISGVVHLS